MGCIVDKYAASGGYLMACVANKVYAAPFASIGSLGAVAQFQSFNKLSKKFGIDSYTIASAKYKAGTNTYGDVSREGLKGMQKFVDKVHETFCGYVQKMRGRKIKNIEDVA